MIKSIVRYSIALIAFCSMPLLAQNLAPNPDFLDGASSHTYKVIDGVALRLHVYHAVNPEQDPAPAIVFFFGGGWRNGSISQFVPHATHLAASGITAIVADYRVANRHGSTVAEALADAKSAVRWIRANAATLDIDPNRLAAGGGSAGGHLAAATAVVTGFDSKRDDHAVSAQPNLLVLFNPALDTARIGPNRPQQFGDDGEALSVLHQLSDASVPTVIFHGKADRTVPYAEAEEYCEKLNGLGGRCDLHGYEGATHGFFNKARDDGRWYRPTVATMDEFLAEQGYLSP